jgi:hypothetical protein
VAENLRGGWNRARLGKFQREPTEDGQVGVEPDALDATDAERRQPVVMLQSSEFAFDGGAATVEPAPFVALAGDAKVALTLVPAELNHGDNITLGTLGRDAVVVVQRMGVEQTRGRIDDWELVTRPAEPGVEYPGIDLLP